MVSRRTAFFLCALLLVGLVAAASATAHRWQDLYFWSPSELYQRDTIAWSFGASEGHEVPEGAVRTSIIAGAHAWNNVPNARLKFDYRPGDAPPAAGPDRCGSQNEPPGHMRSAVYWAPLTGHLENQAIAKTCYNRRRWALDYFRIWFNSANSSGHWSAHSKGPPPRRVDVQSVAAHEFGHATGWQLHIDEGARPHAETDRICKDDNVYRQTMCTYVYQGTARQRSLEAHDRGPFSDAY